MAAQQGAQQVVGGSRAAHSVGPHLLLTTSARLPFLTTLQLVLRLNSHDYPQLAASMIVPVLASLWHRLTAKEEEF